MVRNFFGSQSAARADNNGPNPSDVKETKMSFDYDYYVKYCKDGKWHQIKYDKISEADEQFEELKKQGYEAGKTLLIGSEDQDRWFG